ncbi:methyl-accepting chemotaxis protein [Paenibacillus hexagrammi]|uniref:Methyl-accepting chemotaxis protein n=1 Tax=Paenibacillus hexagrammi TaxID=2908839 RepID=A0ABY3SDU4_9BACL|nr:methyl-accepting chemotaxis protein [Paenibacillus sp. YPD9-1]UJF32164.1 methyl-accepting chemotaxis protein [Paenibacillus sp. YPD9-1]
MKRFFAMSFFSKNLLFTSFNIVLIGAVLIVSSYFLQKDILVSQLQNQIKTVTGNWAAQIDSKQVMQAKEEKDYQGPVQAEIRKQLDLVSQYNPSVAQAYIFGTELQDGNKTSIIAMPTHVAEELTEAKLMAGDLYEQPVVVANMLKRLLATGTPTLTDYYQDDYGIWTTIAYPIKDTNGKIYAYYAVDIDAKAIPEGLHKLLIYGISLLAGFLIIILTFQIIVIRRSFQPIKALIHGIDEVSQGHLDIRIPTGKNDLGRVNEKFNEMVSNMNATIVSIQEASHQLAASAKELNLSSNRNNEHAEVINSSVKEIAKSIQYQENSSFESSRAISDMAEVVQTVAHSSSSVAVEAQAVEQISEKGDTVVKNMTGQMQQINQFVGNLSQSVTILDRRSQEIGNILSMITGIANQTNLLALNAAIEAARVGEHGRGFAVVASEVRKLAEQSQQSAKQIEELIKEIQHEIGQTTDAMQSGKQVVEQGMSVASETGRLFGDILEAIQKVSQRIHEVSTAAQDMSAGTEQIAASAEELTHSAKSTASNATEMTRSIDEQKQSVEEIARSTHQLSSTADELKQLTAQFRVKKEQP